MGGWAAGGRLGPGGWVGGYGAGWDGCRHRNVIKISISDVMSRIATARSKSSASEMADRQLHRDMTKTELDAYLRRCGATETNTYSVDEIFHAVDSNLWADV